MSQMTPREIVQELDKHIVGQDDAKRAVAIALRNRWRRVQVDEPLRSEITPKNILMIGPTGVGKTEISRRLARLAKAPFIKVEATKFTEVGYVGREVDSIIRDLMDVAVKMIREDAMARSGTAPKTPPKNASLTRCCHHRPRPVGFTEMPNRQRRQRHAAEISQDAARRQARRQGNRESTSRQCRSASRSWRRPAWKT